MKQSGYLLSELLIAIDDDLLTRFQHTFQREREEEENPRNDLSRGGGNQI